MEAKSIGTQDNLCLFGLSRLQADVQVPAFVALATSLNHLDVSWASRPGQLNLG